MNNHSISQLQSERLRNLANGNSLLKISLGLIFFTILSSAFVYAETISVNVDGTSYDVDYTVSGMSVSGIEPDPDFISLILSVDVTDSPGVLDITFDRTFFDSIYEGADDDFIILADGDEPNFSETKTTSQSRTLSIELPSGTEEVEIIGSVFGRTIEETPSEPEETPEEPSQKQIPAAFVDPSKDPKVYVERYVTESSYKAWFEENYSDYTFHEALDISKSELDKLIAEIEKENSEPTPVETPEEPTKTTECGPGTILKDGACVLDERCGPGTVLQGDVCVVLEPQTSAPTTSFKGLGKDLGYGVIAAFIVTGAIAIILALMSKASKSSD
ncbi:hypothetical protein AAA799N04_00571 [Marine Group I thaumarchaeote SCGC AAA799-N04]|uniref:Uncharacterized protein n=2 Tax=Marine Group I TaxID=905826 RepID=A0A081RNX8_9ARCH|nr:hypothetical protein AAA799N04_00571 [Marine Group I thaumarchaeote SCGC AAA799-N04]